MFVRRLLWFVAASAALTGFWLALFNLRIWTLVVVGLGVLVGGIVGWSQLNSLEQPKAFTWAVQAVILSFLVFIPVAVVAILVSIENRLCGLGEENGPAAIGWLAPAIAYYSIGYLGFARPRWIRVLWPLAMTVGIFAILAVELIWTTGSGCGD